MDKDNILCPYYLCQFKESSGEITTTLSGYGKGMLQMWAIQNVKKGYDTIVFNAITGLVTLYVDGNGDITKDDGSHIDDYCDGMLDAIADDVQEMLDKYKS